MIKYQDAAGELQLKSLDIKEQIFSLSVRELIIKEPEDIRTGTELNKSAFAINASRRAELIELKAKYLKELEGL